VTNAAAGSTGQDDARAASADAQADLLRRAIEAANERDLAPAAPGAIVVGDDGSASAPPSLETALAFAERFSAEVVVVHTWSIESSLGELSDHHGAIRSFGEVAQTLRARLEAQRRPLTEQHPTVPIQFRVVLARPADALVDLSRDALMLVLGSRGLGALSGLVLGSVSVQCLRRAHCPVLVVPHRSADAG
jgi:nucleotide-binding universal stress UspA family protein